MSSSRFVIVPGVSDLVEDHPFQHWADLTGTDVNDGAASDVVGSTIAAIAGSLIVVADELDGGKLKARFREQSQSPVDCPLLGGGDRVVSELGARAGCLN